MDEVLAEIGFIRLTVGAASIILAFLVWVLFIWLWLADRKKRAGGKKPAAGDWLNALGFGLLPAIMIRKGFENISTTLSGAKVSEPLPMIPWLTEDGCYIPCRIELMAAVICFGIVCLWLILRESDLPGNGDLLLTTLSIWAAVRIFMEGFRQEPWNILRYLCCGIMICCLAWWTVRRNRVCRGPGRTAADWMTVLICIAMLTVSAEGILTVGSPIGDMAVIAGCALLAETMTLIAGSDCRKIFRADDQSLREGQFSLGQDEQESRLI